MAIGRRQRPKRSGVEELRVYTINSLYLVYATVPVIGFLALTSVGITPSTIAAVAILTLHCLICALTLHFVTGQTLDGTPLPAWLFPALAGTTLVCSVLCVVALPGDRLLGPSIMGLLAVLLAAATAISPLVSARGAIGLSVLVGVVCASVDVTLQARTGALASPGAMRDDLVEAAMFVALMAFVVCLVVSLVMVLLTRWSVTILISIHDQAQMDAMRADLAVADERLRIARDLHDVFGRTLTAVSVKSQLAAELSDAGQAGPAAQESRAVTTLSENALREIRVILAGYRAPDLATELAGARSLLDAAGVRTRLVGSPEDVSEDAAEPLARVLREAATNVVRHSDASTCVITVTRTPESATLTVVNDGIRAEDDAVDPESSGSGLLALSARLERLGGTVDYGHTERGRTFTVTANVPISAHDDPPVGSTAPPSEEAHR